ncbi:hypothetical protein [Ruficoccus sp. ZRK36]|uniref:hypothetical protein n=1 Tax=Ruficoccus sp. ZRK36 TaxID=2866311 RepID=UPI001C735F07|nr:hypothetical protein [Ruficoccus sp. ZRK36]QYY37302.1 hypothetical protein K0V07_07405 [Ruficoccus sp. ZRK36]
MNNLRFPVGFSGNRPSQKSGRTFVEIEAARPMLEVAMRGMQTELLTEGQMLSLVCSAAAGADTMACELALEMGVPVNLILPKRRERFMKDFTAYGPQVWKRVEWLLEAVENNLHGSSVEVVPDSVNEPECYEWVNRLILARSRAFLVVWDGMDTGLPAGTGSLVRKVRAGDCPYVFLNTQCPDLIESRGLSRYS